tara:strand:+ start:784 stop:1014 length:231 start_codon:yes stop_codon:yes gene_type:complete
VIEKSLFEKENEKELDKEMLRVKEELKEELDVDDEGLLEWLRRLMEYLNAFDTGQITAEEKAFLEEMRHVPLENDR